MLLAIYRALTLLISVLLWIPFRLHQRGKIRLAERYGFWDLSANEVWWFHGASAGEVAGLMPLVERCRQIDQNRFILVTSTSPTGLERVTAAVNAVRLLPFDHPWYLQRALRRVTVRQLVSAETELWPELANLAQDLKIPFFMVNARLSERSVRRYKFLAPLLRLIDHSVTALLVSDAASAARFERLLFAPEKIRVTGNAKYDISPKFDRASIRQTLRSELGWHDNFVVTLGSLRPGEEIFWFPVIRELQGQGEGIRFVVAPRHREKFQWFAERLEQFGIRYLRRSRSPGSAGDSVLLLDSFGDLEQYYAMGDLAFVGGTLVPIGGHNPLEPAMYEVPVILGPHVAVIPEIAEALWATGGGWRVASASEIASVVIRLCRNSSDVAIAGRQAHDVYASQRGATERIAAVIFSS